MTTPTRVALLGGMGYPVTETPWGMPWLKARLEAIGAQVLLVNWAHRNDVFNFMTGFTGKRLYAGDSLGAGSAGEYPEDVEGACDYAAGFQPSMDDQRTHVIKPGFGVQTVSAKILRAHCVFDPVWYDTLGLGQAHWIKAVGATTTVLNTEHRGAHPDDWGFSQDLIFREMKAIIEA